VAERRRRGEVAEDRKNCREKEKERGRERAREIREIREGREESGEMYKYAIAAGAEDRGRGLPALPPSHC
jgi:hypothetical protein